MAGTVPPGIVNDVSRDGKEPRGEAPAFLKARQASPAADERFLQQILRRITTADTPDQVAEELSPIGRQEFRESVFASGGRCAYQLLLRATACVDVAPLSGYSRILSSVR